MKFSSPIAETLNSNGFRPQTLGEKSSSIDLYLRLIHMTGWKPLQCSDIFPSGLGVAVFASSSH
jgi:hypothetical protein